MNTTHQHRSPKFWDRMAAHYDREEEKDSKTHIEVIERVKPYLKPTDNVLDFGCGTGLFSSEIAGFVQRIDGIDFSSKMIELAREKAQKRQIQNIEYQHTTIFDDSLQPGAYDLILSFYVIHLLEDPQAVFRQVHRLLKPGGVFISVTPCMGDKPFLSGMLSIAAKLGLTPRIKSYKLPDLVSLFKNGNFDATEYQLLPGTPNQYFVVAK